MKIRRLSNGEYYLPRLPREVVFSMNEKYDRVTEHTWRDKLTFDMNRDYTILEPYVGTKAYVICKGKSVDGLKQEHFEPSLPVFATNEAVLLAETICPNNTIIGVRQDGKNRYYYPKRAFMLVKRDIIAYYTGYPNTIPWSYTSLGIQVPMCTLAVILLVLRVLGTVDVTIYGADAHTSKNLTYSDCADAADKAIINSNLLEQRVHLKQYSKGMNCKWIHRDLENWQMEL
jgi:hypothetical protein